MDFYFDQTNELNIRAKTYEKSRISNYIKVEASSFYDAIEKYTKTYDITKHPKITMYAEEYYGDKYKGFSLYIYYVQDVTNSNLGLVPILSINQETALSHYLGNACKVAKTSIKTHECWVFDNLLRTGKKFIIRGSVNIENVRLHEVQV